MANQLNDKLLTKKAERFGQLFSNTGVGIFIVDKKRKILEANDAFCLIFGYEYEEILNKSALELHISEEKYLEFANIAFNRVRKNEALNLKYPFKRKDGNTIWLRIAGDSIPSNEEVLWTITDITDTIATQEKLNKEVQLQLKALRDKDRQLQYQSRLVQMGEMLNMISHQWRQPLSAITATTNLLASKIFLNELKDELFLKEIENIEQFAAHLSTTINDFRSFFKTSKKSEVFSLKDLVLGTLKIVEPILNNHNIKVITDFQCKKTTKSYKNELGQALLNIIKNAEDALLESNTKNPFIKISTFSDNVSLFVSVEDNGGGIEEKVISQIFNSYFSTKLDKDGTGVGLCMSKTIIEEHCKGKIWVKNTTDGAIFFINIPQI